MKKNWGWWIIAILLCFSLLKTGCDRSNKALSQSSTAAQRGVTTITFGDNFYDVSATNKGNVWVVGYYGAILHSNDGGKHWARQNSGGTSSLLGIYFLNDRMGWAVGELGTILHTKDGGATWEKQQSPVLDQRLLKVQFISEQKGWAVGSYGVILHTLDGGAHWERLPYKEDVTLNDLCFLNASEGWVAGEFETILHTTDGGKTWRKQRRSKVGNFFGIGFRDALHGVAVGISGKIVFTKDGGKSWMEVKSPTEDTLLKVQFYGQQRAMAIASGLRGALIWTEDGGENWRLITIPEHYTWLSGVAFTKDGVGYLVGDGGRIFVSSDNGNTWILIGGQGQL